MKKIFLLFTFYFLLFIFGKTQNLVQNSGFDSIISCPPIVTSTPTINLAYYWYDPTGITADLANACNTTGGGGSD